MMNSEKSKIKLNSGKNIEKKTTAHTLRNAFVAFFAAVFSLCLIVIMIVVYVDPFFHYHAPLENFPYVVDNQLSQNPGMAKNMTYDSCIIGSSMTVNFHTDDFESLLGLDTIKLSYSGALPHDDYNILNIVFDKDTLSRKTNDVKAVFVGVDAMTYTAGTDEIKYPLPEYLYDDNILNDVSYVLNKDVLLEYVLRPLVNKSPTNLSEVYESWWTPDYYNINWVMHNYEPSEKVEEVMDEDALIEGTKDNLETNILPFIEAHPETTFYMFFPPYSILYWNDVISENHLDATIEQYRYLADTLLSYDNVRVFYFQNMSDVVTDLNNYADYTHYKPEINQYMVECFANGEHEVTDTSQMDEELLQMQQIVDDFDLEELFSKDY